MQLKQLVEALQPYQIKETDILEWETRLGLEIDVEDGVERYRPQHVQLFKSVQKQLRLGRTLDEIKSLLVLPARKDSVVTNTKEVMVPAELKPTTVKVKNPVSIPSTKAKAKPKPVPAVQPVVQETVAPVQSSQQVDNDPMLMALPAPSPIAPSYTEPAPELLDNAPLRIVPDVDILELDQPRIISNAIEQPAATGVTQQLARLSNPSISFQQALSEADSPSQNTGLLILVDRLVNDKDDLTAQVSELSRYNAHLNKVNTFYKRQIADLENEVKLAVQKVSDLEKTMDSRVRLYRQDDKARLQQQVIDAERATAQVEHDAKRLRQELQTVQQRSQDLTNPQRFIGTWLETATLRGIQFDAFGINIPETRSRLFRLTQAPERVYGATAVIETQYDYRTNTLWKRLETLVVSHHTTETRLQGELIVEYLLEGKTVAKATYTIDCQRQAEEAKTASGVDRI